MNLNYPLIVVGILVFSTLTIFITDGQNTANFKKVLCIIHQETFFKNYSCYSKPINRYKTVVTVNLHVAERIDSMLLHHQMYKKLNVIYRPFLVNVTEDFCKKFVNQARSPYLNIVMNIIQKYSNINHTCPYEGWLIIKDLELDLSSLKLLLPEGGYRYEIKAIIKNRPVLTIQAFLEVASGLRKKN